MPAWLQFAKRNLSCAVCLPRHRDRATDLWLMGICHQRATIVGVLTFTVEWIGITTGFPFGAYDYYPTLGFLVAGCH
ncbi:carotenoid biosynthesis protein [Bacillus sp. SL00103]